MTKLINKIRGTFGTLPQLESLMSMLTLTSIYEIERLYDIYYVEAETDPDEFMKILNFNGLLDIRPGFVGNYLALEHDVFFGEDGVRNKPDAESPTPNVLTGAKLIVDDTKPLIKLAQAVVASADYSAVALYLNNRSRLLTDALNIPYSTFDEIKWGVSVSGDMNQVTISAGDNLNMSAAVVYMDAENIGVIRSTCSFYTKASDNVEENVLLALLLLMVAGVGMTKDKFHMFHGELLEFPPIIQDPELLMDIICDWEKLPRAEGNYITREAAIKMSKDTPRDADETRCIIHRIIDNGLLGNDDTVLVPNKRDTP